MLLTMMVILLQSRLYLSETKVKTFNTLKIMGTTINQISLVIDIPEDILSDIDNGPVVHVAGNLLKTSYFKSLLK